MSFQNFKFPTSTNPNTSTNFKVIKEYKVDLSPLVSKTFPLGAVLEGKRLNKDKQPIKVTEARIACFKAPCPTMWDAEDTAFLEVKSDKSYVIIPIEHLKEIVESKDLSKEEEDAIKLAKVQMEIAKLPIGAERDKLIAQQNALQAELNRASEKNLKLYIGLGIVAVLAISYFAYKKLKK
jgi:hypothetical protein